MQCVRSGTVAGPSLRCSSNIQWHPVLQQLSVHCRGRPSRFPAAAATGSHGHAWAVASASGVVSASEAPTQQRQAASTRRRLILLRHADSETSANLRDYDRPISMQGKREAAKIAQQLCSLGWVPDLIIASNSKRTKQTLDIMVEAATELALVSLGRCGRHLQSFQPRPATTLPCCLPLNSLSSDLKTVRIRGIHAEH